MNELYSFENFIMHCCRLPEWELRDYLTEKLKEVGFSIQNDNYRCSRGGDYLKVHNMLAMRGKPRICLVSHTDVCRDYRKNCSPPIVKPVIKTIKNFYDEEVRIIQDQDCEVQIGGDDRLGVAINTWLALHTGYDLGLLFCTEEEIGCNSSSECDFKELKNFDLVVQVDRGNYKNQLVTNISGLPLCSRKTADKLLAISHNIGMPRQEVMGMMTDVLALKENNKIKEGINLTCGYFNSHGSKEYINIQDSKEAMEFVNEIIKAYELDIIEQDKPKSKKNIKNNDIEVYYRKSSAQVYQLR